MRLLAGCFALVLLLGCAQDGPARNADAPVGWQLTSGVSRGEAVPLVRGYDITLSIDGHEAGGRAACNWYGARIRIDGTSVSFRDFGQTSMGCEPRVEASEEAYLRAMLLVDTAAMEGETLVLSGPDVVLRFAPIPPVPLDSIVDRVWVLDSLIDGDDSAQAAGSPTLELGAEGTLIASTGCRRIHGTFVIKAGVVLMTRSSATGDCTPDLQDQDSHVTDVLGDSFSAAVDDDRLILTSMGRRSLVYRPR